MKLHRFYNPTEIDDGVSSMEGATTTFTDVSHQWAKVLRLVRGERVVLFDGSGNDFFCEILDYQGETVILKIIEKKKNSVTAARKIVLYAALVKKDTFEWIVQKATELGVSDIIPVLADRSEKKNISEERLQKIIIEAAEQSGRGTLPKLHAQATIPDILANIINGDLPAAIVFDPAAVKISGDEKNNAPETIAIFIGPEGGWSPDELEAFKKSDTVVRSLGPQILRAETAVVAALSMFAF